MPRFAITKYTPAKDSSPGLKVGVDPERVVLLIKERVPAPPGDGPKLGCPCGCGEIPAGRRAIFKMGHDARLRGKLIRAHLTNTEIVYVLGSLAGKPQAPQTAVQVANLYGWAPYLEDAALRRAGTVRPLGERILGARRSFKVGRIEYVGTVIAEHETPANEQFDVAYLLEYELEYELRNGTPSKVRVPASQTKAV